MSAWFLHSKLSCTLVIFLICMAPACQPVALRHTYQVNTSCPCYNYYVGSGDYCFDAIPFYNFDQSDYFDDNSFLAKRIT